MRVADQVPTVFHWPHVVLLIDDELSRAAIQRGLLTIVSILPDLREKFGPFRRGPSEPGANPRGTTRAHSISYGGGPPDRGPRNTPARASASGVEGPGAPLGCPRAQRRLSLSSGVGLSASTQARSITKRGPVDSNH